MFLLFAHITACSRGVISAYAASGLLTNQLFLASLCQQPQHRRSAVPTIIWFGHNEMRFLVADFQPLGAFFLFRCLFLAGRLREVRVVEQIVMCARFARMGSSSRGSSAARRS